jgi:hypothetical protein
MSFGTALATLNANRRAHVTQAQRRPKVHDRAARRR